MTTRHPADRGELGRRGEALACARLTEAGLRIVARNWRCQTGEIDVVAEAPGLLVFCEVKTRRGVGYGTPAAAVNAAKQAQLRRLAGAYLRATPHRPVRPLWPPAGPAPGCWSSPRPTWSRPPSSPTCAWPAPPRWPRSETG
jgi:putative endonuclease